MIENTVDLSKFTFCSNLSFIKFEAIIILTVINTYCILFIEYQRFKCLEIYLTSAKIFLNYFSHFVVIINFKYAFWNRVCYIYVYVSIYLYLYLYIYIPILSFENKTYVIFSNCQKIFHKRNNASLDDIYDIQSNILIGMEQ